MLSDEQIIAKYGKPGDPDNLTTITLPYPMRIAWDLSHSVTKIQCNKLVATALLNVFNDILANYGYEKLKEFEIDLYGGCVNVRLMRGSKTRWSRHSWGIAIDLSPAKNGLKTKKPAAQFSQPEYKKMISLFYKNGFLGYGPEKDYDWMHFEIAS
jgi:hypothetical protein